MAPIIIVGSGQAGVSVAREFRKLNSETAVLLITADDGAGYYKPNLSKALASGKDAESLITAEADALADQLGVQLLTDSEVIAINTQDNTIQLADSTLEFSQLVLAQGAHCRQLAFAGNAADQVLSVNNRLDYQQFRQRLAAAEHVTIIGGGLIGCEFANDLATADFAVSVVDPLDWPLGRLLPERAGNALRQGLANAGTDWHLGRQVASLNKENNRVAVELDDGSQWPTDLILSAVGLLPNTKLANKAGMDVGKGIIVDQQLRTSADNVFALGDCCELNGQLLPYIAPILHCAKVIAKCLNGDSAELTLPAMPVIVKTPACPTVISPPPESAAGSWQIAGDEPNLECRFESDSGELLGCALLGEASKKRMAYQRELPPVM